MDALRLAKVVPLCRTPSCLQQSRNGQTPHTPPFHKVIMAKHPGQPFSQSQKAQAPLKPIQHNQKARTPRQPVPQSHNGQTAPTAGSTKSPMSNTSCKLFGKITKAKHPTRPISQIYNARQPIQSLRRSHNDKHPVQPVGQSPNAAR